MENDNESGVSMIELGTITFREFWEAVANPPAKNFGFDIAPENEAEFRAFLDSPSV